MQIQNDPRFKDITPFEKRQWLASPTMHGEELEYIHEAFDTNWMSTLGKNIDEVERLLKEKIGVPAAVGLGTGTAALHLAIRYAGQELYGKPRAFEGTLKGRHVFCSDMTFDATVNPVAYEGGEAVFIDAERDTWNMDPDALERAFELYPDTKMVVLAHLYGTPAKITEIRKICDAHGALLIEDAAESLGAYLAFSDGTSTMTGAFGDIGIISFNGNKIITGSCGGALLAHAQEVADRIRKWSTQSRESALWYQHEELGYNYRMSNVVAGVIRGQLGHLEEHIAQKKAIYERYREGFFNLPVTMNPLGGAESHPNYWLSCVLIDRDAMCPAERTETETTWTHVPGRSCPDELFEALKTFNAEGRPIWKPMHMQPIYREHPFVTAAGSAAPADQPAHSDTPPEDPSVSADIFARGFCLPSDNKMTPEDQDRIIEIVRRCFA